MSLLGKSSHLSLLVLQPNRKPPRIQPFDAEHVLRRRNGAFHAGAVFAISRVAGAVVDFVFGDAVAGGFDEGGDEPVHADKWDKGFAALAAHGFEGAAGVADAVSGEAAADAVGDFALGTLEGGVFAFAAVTAGEIGAVFFQLGDEKGNVGGIVLEIAVEEGDVLTFGRHDSGEHGGALAGVFGELENADVRIAADSFDGLVAGTVIDEDEFVVPTRECAAATSSWRGRTLSSSL